MIVPYALDLSNRPGAAKMGVMSIGEFDDFYAIIPAGGTGTRLWPLSRAACPKFLYDLLGSGRSMLQATFDRLTPLAGAGHVVVSTGAQHEAAVREQLPQLGPQNLFTEPVPRDSMAAIALATAVLARRHGRDIVVGSFAADHVIRDNRAFAESVRQAIAAARAGYVTTIGIAATRPSTAFGYIRQGRSLADRIPDAPDARIVERFVEKPDAATALAYLSTGDYRWNAGMFVMRADVLLDRLREFKPELAETIDRIADAWVDGPDARLVAMDRYWPGLEKIAVDYAIAEPLSLAGGVAVVPGGFGWDDVGDFNSLAALLPSVTRTNVKIAGDAERVSCLDCAGDVVVPGSGRLVALLGVDDLVVVDTPDVLLVAPRARSQEVKDMVAHVRESGHVDVL